MQESRMARLLGIDVGTSGCKVLLIDEEGKVLKQASAEYPLSSPKPGWTEQNPEDWWRGVQDCLSQIGESRPDAIGVTGQMHGSVFLDAAGEVIRPALLWNDQRTVNEMVEINRIVGHKIHQITGNPALTGFQLPKVLWLRNNELSNYQKVRMILLPKDYIRYKVTGTFATEVSDASGSGLFDVGGRKWASDMAALLEIDLNLFPKAYESYEVTGHTKEVAGLDAGIPVVGGGGDQAAAAVGTGAVEPGIISVSLGTSGVVFTALPEYAYDPTGAVHAFCHANGGWHAMGVMLSCGGALRWFRDTIEPGTSYDSISAEAATITPGSESLYFLPYLTGERTPHNDTTATAAWLGLTLRHTRAHMARAVFEGISYGLRDGLDAVRKMGADVGEIRLTGGGAKSSFWRQLLADVFETPCSTMETDEGPAFGAAILAGVGVGIYRDVAEGCAKTVRRRLTVAPTGVNYQGSVEEFRALYPCLMGIGQ